MIYHVLVRFFIDLWIRKRRGAAILFILFAQSAYADRVAILVDSENEIYSITSKAISEYLVSKVPDVVVETFNPKTESLPEDVDVLAPLGSALTAWAREQGLGASIVFGMVLNPQQSGLGIQQDEKIPITGVSLNIPVETKLNHIRQVIPGIRRIGLLVGNQKLDSVRENQQKEIAALGCEAVVIPVDGPNDLPKKLERLTREADLLWMVPDANIYNTQTVRYLIPYSIKSRLPVLALSRSYTKAGALMTVDWDFREMGKQIGETIAQVLSGTSANSIPISNPRGANLVVNKRTADRIGITKIPDVLDIEIVSR